MIQPCPFCEYVLMDELVVLAKDDALDKAKPPAVHGHRLWRVASASTSSWWFYRAPDREVLREMFAWSRAYSMRIACRLATYADVRMCVDDSPAGDQR